LRPADYTLHLCALASVGTLAYVASSVGKPAEIEELVLFIWPLSPYGFIAVISFRVRQSSFWGGTLLLSVFACVLIAVSRFFMFWLSAASDPGYMNIIIRVGFIRVPLEQWASLFFIIFAAWFLSFFRKRWNPTQCRLLAQCTRSARILRRHANRRIAAPRTRAAILHPMADL